MHAPHGIGRKVRQFNRKYGVAIFIVFIVVTVVALVGLLMWMLTSPDWRMRW
jgi:cell division septal protein FtsQ